MILTVEAKDAILNMKINELTWRQRNLIAALDQIYFKKESGQTYCSCENVCSYHVMYAFQNESTLHSCLNVK